MSLSLACILAEAARAHPERVAVIDDTGRHTYAELWTQTLALAAGLRESGVRPGDRVALMATNSADFARAYFAILSVGAVVVPVHLLLAAKEIAHVLQDSGARLLISDHLLAEGAVRGTEGSGLPVLTVGAAEGSAPTRLEDVAAQVAPLTGYVTRLAQDPAVILYTSGTTGTPKGAVLSQLNLIMNATVNGYDANDTRSTDVVMGCLPLFHAFGQTVAMNTAFRLGATLVLMRRFEPAAALELMVRHGVTVFHGVPTMYVALVGSVAADPQRSLPPLRLCVSGGASLPMAVLERFEELFQTTVYEGYGLSETSPTATTNQPSMGTRPGTVGHPVWGVEVEIARQDLPDRIELCATGELGEIVIRGHNVFLGYHNLPEATAEAIVDGWFRSGDLGTKDVDGFITVVDRTKDVVIRGGFNVYPSEVEGELMRHPGIAQVAVIGLPHPLHGEEVCAVVVPADPADPPSAAEIIGWASERIGRHKYPRLVELVDALPLGPSGKVLKRELRRRYADSDGA
ncbi:long-chain-fatty-acid--CoA ligase [Actinoalloteichus hymeniacidonis]|uniref:Acyl-CoA synthetase (AMP-forming)/AMP-acid ligase II n=1 Tax=Actinoalloteichus hymeniacidonis TaxID=340345 RepID=A0AAC9HPX5_9PSEU|nr:long-chain fatty acid--CoA ligase [Actinoalloteichus hymeniacidonis]AOS63334.1 acyl-CoA synthetase (AMP-forming)/AMP-acid ligase II [Actinoalloteichus hymeniacidonis]MBB5908627.1 long-chain acyl-CoA synthetase [Actinoalloteichus hymeniacidonis]